MTKLQILLMCVLVVHDKGCSIHKYCSLWEVFHRLSLDRLAFSKQQSYQIGLVTAYLYELRICRDFNDSYYSRY